MTPPAKSRAREDEVSLGAVVGVFGRRGEVRVHLHHRSSKLFDAGREVLLVAPDGTRRTVHLTTRPGAGGRILGRIRGLRFRDEARALIGCELVLAKAELPEAPEGAWYHHELLGARVESEDGRLLGELVEIHASAEVDVWLVRGEDGGEIGVPALRETVLRVDPERRLVVVREPG